jgi:hypothetical protein
MMKGYSSANAKIQTVKLSRDCQIQVFINPDPEEKRYLIEDLKVDEHTLNSALDPDEISLSSSSPTTWRSFQNAKEFIPAMTSPIQGSLDRCIPVRRQARNSSIRRVPFLKASSS